MMGDAISEITDNHELMKVFHEETRDLLNRMKKDLVTVSKEPVAEGEEEERSALRRRLFLYAHNIKSSAGSVGLNDLREVAQALEKILKDVSENERELDVEVVKILREGIEVCRKMLNKEDVPDYAVMLEQLNNIIPT